MRREILWFSVPACAAVGIGLWLLRKKAGNRPEQNEHNRGAAVPPVTNQKTASYSFISGFRNAATVELSFPYDADRFSYTVCEEGHLAESGDSHVGILYGEAFSMQLEYAAYYHDEDFAALSRELAEKHPDLSSVRFGALEGVQYQDGDNWCLSFPIPDDASSYLLITLVKASDNDDDLSDLPEYPDVRAMLSALQFSRS